MHFVDRDEAIRCRGLAAAALLALRPFPEGTTERLNTERVRIINGKVHVDFPDSIVKNRRPIQRPLPEVPWHHRMLAIYTERARPLLLRGGDEGYWFTTCGANGGRASHSRGRASYSMTPSHFERVPDGLTAKIVSSNRK